MDGQGMPTLFGAAEIEQLAPHVQPKHLQAKHVQSEHVQQQRGAAEANEAGSTDQGATRPQLPGEQSQEGMPGEHWDDHWDEPWHGRSSEEFHDPGGQPGEAWGDFGNPDGFLPPLEFSEGELQARAMEGGDSWDDPWADAGMRELPDELKGELLQEAAEPAGILDRLPWELRNASFGQVALALSVAGPAPERGTWPPPELPVWQRRREEDKAALPAPAPAAGPAPISSPAELISNELEAAGHRQVMHWGEPRLPQGVRLALINDSSHPEAGSDTISLALSLASLGAEVILSEQPGERLAARTLAEVGAQHLIFCPIYRCDGQDEALARELASLGALALQGQNPPSRALQVDLAQACFIVSGSGEAIRAGQRAMEQGKMVFCLPPASDAAGYDANRRLLALGATRVDDSSELEELLEHC